MVDQRILGYCARGADFNSQARLANALSIGDVYYVDLANGADGSSGANWDEAMLTINATLDMCTAGKNDYIIVRGPTGAAAGVATQATLDTIDVAGVHVIGFSGAMNPWYPGYAQRRRYGIYDGPTVLIEANDVEYAGWEVQGRMDAGAWAVDNAKAPLQAGLLTQGRERIYIHDVFVNDAAAAYTESTGGIALINQHRPVLERVSIRSTFGNIDYGLQLLPGVGPCLDGIIKDCIIGGTGQGLMATGIDLSFDSAQNIQGFTLDEIKFPRVTQCIDFGNDWASYATITNFVSSAGVATSFAGTNASANKANLLTNFLVTSEGWCADGIWA